MGPNNICYVARHFLFFPYVPIMSLLCDLDVTFYMVIIKGHVGFLQLLKWPCHTFVFFTYVVPSIGYSCISFYVAQTVV